MFNGRSVGTRLALSLKNTLALSGLLRISAALFNNVEVISFGGKLVRVLLSSTITLAIRGYANAFPNKTLLL